MELRPGARWRSAACATEVMVVKPPARAVTLECAGQAMLALLAGGAPPGAIPSQASGGTQLGKRYADETSGLEVLCTKAGTGALSADGRGLVAKEARRLPSSD